MKHCEAIYAVGLNYVSARRGRHAAQLFCKTGTSYSPVKQTFILLSSLGGDIEDTWDFGDRRAKLSSA